MAVKSSWLIDRSMACETRSISVAEREVSVIRVVPQPAQVTATSPQAESARMAHVPCMPQSPMNRRQGPRRGEGAGRRGRASEEGWGYSVSVRTYKGNPGCGWACETGGLSICRWRGRSAASGRPTRRSGSRHLDRAHADRVLDPGGGARPQPRSFCRPLSRPLPDEDEVVLREDVVPPEGAFAAVSMAEVHEATVVAPAAEAILPDVRLHEGDGVVVHVYRGGMVLAFRPPQVEDVTARGWQVNRLVEPR